MTRIHVTRHSTHIIPVTLHKHKESTHSSALTPSQGHSGLGQQSCCPRSGASWQSSAGLNHPTAARGWASVIREALHVARHDPFTEAENCRTQGAATSKERTGQFIPCIGKQPGEKRGLPPLWADWQCMDVYMSCEYSTVCPGQRNYGSTVPMHDRHSLRHRKTNPTVTQPTAKRMSCLHSAHDRTQARGWKQAVASACTAPSQGNARYKHWHQRVVK